MKYVLYWSDDIFIAEQNQILYKTFSGVWSKDAITFRQKRCYLGGEFGRLSRITCRNLKGRKVRELDNCITEIYLRDEGYQLPVVFSLLIGINFEYLANAVVMIPLLQKLFSVGDWITFD